MRMQAATLSLMMAMLPARGTGQQQATQADQPPENQVKPEAAKASPYTWEDLLNKKPGAIENEKKAFAKETNPWRKQRMASVLLHLGVRDQIYFDYLASEAKKALADETPWPTLYDEEGNINKKATHPAFAAWMKKLGFDPEDPRFIAFREYDPKFLDWCKKNGQDPNEATKAANFDSPDPVYHLAAAGDARAYDLLIEGLHSHNFMIVTEAAEGLAFLQDRRAIPELIAIGPKLPVEVKVQIAISLLYFSDAKAQAAANKMAGDSKHFQVISATVKERGFKYLLEGYW
jgi:uncharacterized protein YciI